MQLDRSFKTTCLKKTLIAPSIYELRFEKPSGFSFKAGQFVLFDVPLLDNATDIQPRAYSIASAPSETELLFVIKLVPNGRASRWIEHAVCAGTVIRMQGPFGAFTLDTANTKPYLFIATGTGIAPLRSQILSALRERKDTRSMQLVFGVLRRADLFWMQEWRALQREYPQLYVEACVLEEHGLMQEQIPRLVQDFGAVSLYICGAPETVNDVKTRCMAWGVPKQDIHAESYV